MARRTRFLTDAELYNSLTINPANTWKLNTGAVEEGKDADLVISKQKTGSINANAFFSIDPEDILTVICKGKIVLFDEELNPQLKALNMGEYSQININGSYKYVKGDLPALMNEIKQYYPQAGFPVS